MDKKYIGIALALDDVFDRQGAGYVKRPVSGTVSRYDTLNHAIPLYAPKVRIYASAGYSRESPLEASPERTVALADQLKRFVSTYRRQSLKRLEARGCCWSTRSEVRVGIKMALREGFAQKDEDAMLVIASNAAHLPRVALYALVYKPEAWDLMLVRARHRFGLIDTLLEAPKIVRDLVYFGRVFYRLRRMRPVLNRMQVGTPSREAATSSEAVVYHEEEGERFALVPNEAE